MIVLFAGFCGAIWGVALYGITGNALTGLITAAVIGFVAAVIFRGMGRGDGS